MRVGYVLKRYPRYSETFVVNEILAHEAAGLELEIFALRPPLDTHFQDVIARVRAPVHYIPSASPKGADLWRALAGMGREQPGFGAALEAYWDVSAGDLYQSLLLAREVRKRGIRHLHAHFGTVATTVARIASQLTGRSYTFTAHAKDIFHEDVVVEDLARKQRDAAGVVTVSEFNLRFLREQYGEEAAGVRRIYNGLDLERFPFEEPRERAPRVLAVGRLVEKKGFADLVEACGLLAGRGVSFSCEILGSGPEEQDLRERIDRLGLHGKVELTGPRPQAEVVAHLREAAAFAAPCIIGADGNRDGLPTTLLEAMALGAPCISTDVTGIPEVVRHEETGLMVPQHDPGSLAAALERLLVEPETRVQLARRARALIETEFDVHKNAARQRELFRDSAAGAA